MTDVPTRDWTIVCSSLYSFVHSFVHLAGWRIVFRCGPVVKRLHSFKNQKVENEFFSYFETEMFFFSIILANEF